MQFLATLLLNVLFFLLTSRSCEAAPLGVNVRRSDSKYVFMHHILGNTYSYTLEDWKDDVRKMAAGGVDAIALNIGSDSWQPNQIANAYEAAKESDLKMFISYDFTVFPCDVAAVVNLQNQYSSHPSQFKVDGKPMISSYEGACIGASGWEQIKQQTGGYTMPFISGLEGQFGAWDRALDSWLCWGCAWPQGNRNKTIDDDMYYISQLGDKYAATVSPWMFTHYSYKNWYQRGDHWLINTRWEQLVEIRDSLTFVEMVTWNDFGESDYFGPIKGDQPQGTTWAGGEFDHSPFFEMSEYYISAFKTGSYPEITKDKLYYWSRPHPAGATATADPIPAPQCSDCAEDYIWVVVFATDDATVQISIGDHKTEESVSKGINKLKAPMYPEGLVQLSLTRNGETIIQKTDDSFTYTASPELYNFNAYIGSASTTEA